MGCPLLFNLCIMGKLRDLGAKLEKWEITDEELLGIFDKPEVQAYVIDLNRSQLMKGLNSDGTILGRYSDEHYAKFKKFLNPLAGGYVDLFLEGNFQEGFFVESERFPITLSSHDKKSGKLSEGYDKIFGLTKGNLQLLREFLKPYIIDIFKNKGVKL